jgi:hypothetical protein
MTTNNDWMPTLPKPGDTCVIQIDGKQYAVTIGEPANAHGLDAKVTAKAKGKRKAPE